MDVPFLKSQIQNPAERSEYTERSGVKSKIKSAVLLCVLALFLPATAFAQDAGAGAFSRFGTSARGLAIGNAVTADPSANASLYYNPALAPRTNRQRLSASVALLSFDRELQVLEFTTPLGPTAGVGLGVIRGGVSGIDGRDVNGARTEELSTDEFAVFLAFGNRFAERLSVGATLKVFQSEFVDTAPSVRSFGLDLGTTVTVTDAWTVGLTVSDLLAKYEWQAASAGGLSVTDRFPVRVRVGSSVDLLSGRLRVNAEVESRTTTQDDILRRTSLTTTGPRTQRETNALQFTDLSGRLGATYRLVDVFRARAGLDRIGVDGTAGLRPTAGFDVETSVGDLDLRAAYALALSPYLRDPSSFLTLEIYL